MPEEDHEDQLRAKQDGRVYPLGRALRATYDADNHATLGSDVTGLMMDLSKIPFGPEEMEGGLRPAAAPPPAASAWSWRDVVDNLWSWRPRTGRPG